MSGRILLWLLFSICISQLAGAQPGVPNYAVPPLPSDGLFHINRLGQWSYAAALLPYYGLLIWLAIRYRVVFRFATWKFFFFLTAALLLVLGVAFEWIADVLYVWTFPPGRDLCMIRVPIFGWIFGHEIPICEFLWIVGVIPLFYFLYLWATLAFYDIIYVVDKDGNTYKREERWVGPHEPTRILVRKKFEAGEDRNLKHEEEKFRRNPTWVGRKAKRFFDVKES